MGKRILVVDDDPTSLKLLDLILNKEGYQVMTASNGLEALRKARLESPDLLILDVMLPGFDGFEICHRLRTEPATATMPIMMLSSKQQKSDQDAASKVGANAFLSKPVDRTALLTKVAELLGDQKPPEPEPKPNAT
jgi:two-component system cell cycle response regulator